MKKIIVLVIASILSLSGILVGAGDIDYENNIEQNESNVNNFQTNLCNPTVSIPPFLITMNVQNTFCAGLTYFDTTFSAIGPGYDVSDGVYDGYCGDPDISISSGKNYPTQLYSSYDPSLPVSLQGKDWPKVNWILNNKISDHVQLQYAIWTILGHPAPTNGYSDACTGDGKLTTETQNLVTAAHANSDFCPEPGEKIAIICYVREDVQPTFIEITVPPTRRCTLTPGYWKTHSEYGPAGPRDNAWDGILPDGEDSEFFCTGISYYEILWMNPKGGKAYIILAHQYIAAELNSIANGGLPSTIHDYMEDAEPLLIQYCSNLQIPKKSPDRIEAIWIAFVLDCFNNGFYPGWPHCSDFNSID